MANYVGVQVFFAVRCRAGCVPQFCIYLGRMGFALTRWPHSLLDAFT